MIFVIDNTEIVDELFPKKRINNSWISWKKNPINDCTKAVDFFISSRKKGFLYWTVNLNSSTRIEWRNRIVTYTRFTRLKFYISYYCSNIFLSRLLNFKLSISNPISLSNHCFKKKTKLLFYTFKLCHISTNFNNLLISSSFSLSGPRKYRPILHSRLSSPDLLLFCSSRISNLSTCRGYFVARFPKFTIDSLSGPLHYVTVL